MPVLLVIILTFLFSCASPEEDVEVSLVFSNFHNDGSITIKESFQSFNGHANENESRANYFANNENWDAAFMVIDLSRVKPGQYALSLTTGTHGPLKIEFDPSYDGSFCGFALPVSRCYKAVGGKVNVLSSHSFTFADVLMLHTSHESYEPFEEPVTSTFIMNGWAKWK